jgi:hypothetical protein
VQQAQPVGLQAAQLQFNCRRAAKQQQQQQQQQQQKVLSAKQTQHCVKELQT